MKRILTATLTALILLISGPLPAADGEPCGNNAKTIDKGDKIVICLSDVNTDGLNLRVFNPEGMIIEKTTLSGTGLNYEITKPEKGIYWVSMKNGTEVKFQRFIVR